MTQLEKARLIEPLTSEAFDVQWDAEHTFPFFEDEHADGVWGYGHHDKKEFADLVNSFDQLCSLSEIDPADLYTADNVHHSYGQAFTHSPEDEPAEWFIITENVTESSPNAFPLTIISR